MAKPDTVPSPDESLLAVCAEQAFAEAQRWHIEAVHQQKLVEDLTAQLAVMTKRAVDAEEAARLARGQAKRLRDRLAGNAPSPTAPARPAVAPTAPVAVPAPVAAPVEPGGLLEID